MPIFHHLHRLRVTNWCFEPFEPLKTVLLFLDFAAVMYKLTQKSTIIKLNPLILSISGDVPTKLDSDYPSESLEVIILRLTRLSFISMFPLHRF